MNYETLAVDPQDNILVVKLNRPEVLNAINTQMGRDLFDLWTRLTAEPGEARCVVFKATGCGARLLRRCDLKSARRMTPANCRRNTRSSSGDSGA